MPHARSRRRHQEPISRGLKVERYALLLKVHVSLSRFLRPLSLLPLCSRHGRSLGARAETAVPNDAEAQEQQREQQEKHMTTPRRLNPPPGKKNNHERRDRSVDGSPERQPQAGSSRGSVCKIGV